TESRPAVPPLSPDFSHRLIWSIIESLTSRPVRHAVANRSSRADETDSHHAIFSLAPRVSSDFLLKPTGSPVVVGDLCLRDEHAFHPGHGRQKSARPRLFGLRCQIT